MLFIKALICLNGKTCFEAMHYYLRTQILQTEQNIAFLLLELLIFQL